MKTQWSKNYRTQPKQLLRGKFIVIQVYLRKQEKPPKKKKNSNLTPNGTRERRTDKTQC